MIVNRQHSLLSQKHPQKNRSTASHQNTGDPCKPEQPDTSSRTTGRVTSNLLLVDNAIGLLKKLPVPKSFFLTFPTKYKICRFKSTLISALHHDHLSLASLQHPRHHTSSFSMRYLYVCHISPQSFSAQPFGRSFQILPCVVRS